MLTSFEKKMLKKAVAYATVNSPTVYYSSEMDMMNRYNDVGFDKLSKLGRDVLRFALIDTMTNGYDDLKSYEHAVMRNLYHRFNRKNKILERTQKKSA